jgi:hypothetical protein
MHIASHSDFRTQANGYPGRLPAQLHEITGKTSPTDGERENLNK